VKALPKKLVFDESFNNCTMSRFYEVRRRDGAARSGILSLPGEKKHTPLLFHVESLHSGKEGFGYFQLKIRTSAICSRKGNGMLSGVRFSLRQNIAFYPYSIISQLCINNRSN
jgi:hypothetical protein